MNERGDGRDLDSSIITTLPRGVSMAFIAPNAHRTEVKYAIVEQSIGFVLSRRVICICLKIHPNSVVIGP